LGHSLIPQNPYEPPQTALPINRQDQQVESRSALEQRFMEIIGAHWEIVCLGAEKCLFAIRIMVYLAVFLVAAGLGITLLMSNGSLFLICLGLTLLASIILIICAVYHQIEGVSYLSKVESTTGARSFLKTARNLFIIYLIVSFISTINSVKDSYKQVARTSFNTNSRTQFGQFTQPSIKLGPRQKITRVAELLLYLGYSISFLIGIMKIGRSINDESIVKYSKYSILFTIVSTFISTAIAYFIYFSPNLGKNLVIVISLCTLVAYCVALMTYANALSRIVSYKQSLAV
jgi:hypothetical protein